MKTLKKLIEGYGSKHDQGTRKPGEVGPDKVFKDNTPVSKKGNAPAPTEGSQEFVDDHVIDRIKDANGNDDKLFKASNIKPTEREKGRHGYSAKKAEDVNEKRLTMKELKKREEVAQAIERDNPGMDMSKKMAIATSTAKKVAEDLKTAISGLSPRLQETMKTAFDKLHEDNQVKFAAACATEEGLEKMVAFAIENRGE